MVETSRHSRVFLSYARGDDEAFVRQLYEDLTVRGVDVWFDRVSMPSRQLTFHQEIADAIRERDRLILVVGPKAALSDYVRQEWRWALELDKPVIPLLRQGDYAHIPGELGLVHCDDFRDDAQYPAQLAKLIENLRRPAPPLGALFGVPSLPLHFLGRPELLRRVKDALRVDLQKPVVITGEGARVGMQGMGGIGKSVLAAALARDPEVRRSYPDGIVWAAVGQQPDRVSLQRDVARHLGCHELFDTESQGLGALRQLLAQKAVLLVLDDVWNARDAQAFDALGPRCRALITTRDAGILHTLHGQSIPVSLFTEAEALQLLADAVGVQRTDLPPEAREVVTECGCLPLAVALCGGMAKKNAGDWGAILQRLRRADLEKIADREAINEQHRSIWRAMQVSVDALAPEQQRRFAELAVFAAGSLMPEAAVRTLWAHTGNLDDLDTTDLLIELGDRSLIQLDQKATKPDEGVERRFRLHDLLYDYATRIAGDPVPLHDQLLDAYRKLCPNGWPSGPNDGYFFQHLLEHMLKAGRNANVVELLQDLPWLEAKTEAGLVFELANDFTAAVAALPDAESHRRILILLEEALRRDVHFVARHSQDYPQALFQCLWNSCWWYDCPEATGHHVEPKDELREPQPWEQSGPKLHQLLEAWRSAKEKKIPAFFWVRSHRPPPIHLGTALRAVFRGHEGTVNRVSFSPDGTRIASGSDDRTVRVWDAVMGRELACLRGHEHVVESVSFSPDGTRIASGSIDHTIRLWDAETGEELRCLRGHESSVESVSFSPDGKRIASGSYDKTVRLWDAESGAELHCLRGHEFPVVSVAFSPDGRRIVSGSEGWIYPGYHTVRVWDVESGAELRCLRGHEDTVTSVAVSPDGTLIASGSKDKTVRVWDADKGTELRCLRAHEGSVTSVSFSPDGTRIASGSWDETVRVWDTATGRELACLHGHYQVVESVSFSPDGTRVASGSWDKTVRVWDASTGRKLTRLRGQQGFVCSVSFSPDGTRIASGSGDKTVQVWDAATGRELACLRGHEHLVESVFFSPDGARIASRSWDHTFRVWDATTGRELICLRESRLTVAGVSFSPDGARIAWGPRDSTVRVWDLTTGGELACLRGHVDAVSSVSFSPDGTRIASGSGDNTVRLWNGATGLELACLCGHEGYVCSVTFSPDGSRIASGSGDKTVRVWDSTSGRELACLRGHENAVSRVFFSPDGTRIASGSVLDRTLRVWDAASGECLEVIRGQEEHPKPDPEGQEADLNAIADPEHFPWRVRRLGLETPVELARHHQVIAWFSEQLVQIRTYPSGRTWAGTSVDRHNLYIISLEGLIES